MKIQRKFSTALLTIAFGAVVAHAEVKVENRVAKIYPLGGSTAGAPDFVQKTRIETDGSTTRTKATIEDKDQNVVMTETSVFENGKIVEQAVGQLQINERYELKVKDGQATFRTFKSVDGKEKLSEEKSEKVAGTFVTGPGTEGFLKSSREMLSKGESVYAQFGIFELARSVKFEFKGTKGGEGENLKVSMEPASFWLSVLVSTIHMEMDPNTFQIVRYKGRTPLRTKVNGSWKPLDAEIHYFVAAEDAQPKQ